MEHDDRESLEAHAQEFEREAREAPEEYYEGLISGCEADREIDELAHLTEVARALEHRDER